MATSICFGIQKGGCSKTTTAGIVSYMFAENSRVLAVDMDCQGNLTELLTKKAASEFVDNTILEALRDSDAEKYIFRVNDRLDVLPANNLLAILPRTLYEKFGLRSRSVYLQLRKILQPLQDRYDYIIIDTPPALSEHTMNALVASDYVVVMYESSAWCYSAVPNFIDSVSVAKQLNPQLKIAGILRTLNDVRRYDSKAFNDLIAEEYPDLVFQTIIRRKAATGRLSYYGFTDENNEIDEAIDQFKDFFKELNERVVK
ncbi:ParA family protein [Brevibacillus marinus]|uniref:ParA family protein n=1 Tax=Brevibacillus marinus TaxID=2496837 RepID=UPI000F81D780|nr:ParA family protein [Brevibacillus marinus]